MFTLRATSIAAITAVLLGQPMVAGAAVLSGAALDLGRICLNISKKRHSFKNFKRGTWVGLYISCKR